MTFVDAPIYRLGRMTMCHMVADTTEELLAMADRIGVARRWIQKAGQPDEHFDVCKSKRALAIRHGAVAVTAREIVGVIAKKMAAARGTL